MAFEIEIHIMSPQNNMNLINEPSMYNSLSQDEYHFHDFVNFDQDYSHFTLSPHNCLNGEFKLEVTNIPFNLMFSTLHEKRMNCKL
jgi:hypothetical protein